MACSETSARDSRSCPFPSTRRFASFRAMIAFPLDHSMIEEVMSTWTAKQGQQDPASQGKHRTLENPGYQSPCQNTMNSRSCGIMETMPQHQGLKVQVTIRPLSHARS